MVDADFSAVRKRSRPETSIPIDDSLTVETRQDSSNMLDFVGHDLTGLAQPQGGPTLQCARDPGSIKSDFSSRANGNRRQLSDSVINVTLEEFKTFPCYTPHKELLCLDKS